MARHTSCQLRPAQATTAGDGAIAELQTTPQRPLDMNFSFPVAMARHKGAECMTGYGTRPCMFKSRTPPPLASAEVVHWQRDRRRLGLGASRRAELCRALLIAQRDERRIAAHNGLPQPRPPPSVSAATGLAETTSAGISGGGTLVFPPDKGGSKTMSSESSGDEYTVGSSSVSLTFFSL